jgi:hypothetical protein
VHLPAPRGPLSERLGYVLRRTPQPVDAALLDCARDAAAGAGLEDEDLQVSLWVLYEQHYRGFDDVDSRWEWSPDLLAARAVLEGSFERALEKFVAPPAPDGDIAKALFALAAEDEAPLLSAYLDRRANLEQFREFVMHRSIYHLKEADPHTWAIPRLHGAAKAALVEIQADEYGGGRPERMHSELFRRTMRALDLDDTYGAGVDYAPAVTLATVNAMSLFGLHRRRRGASAGHLAAFEMTSSLPNRRYGNGLRRLGLGPEATEFYDEHVEADAAHEQIAVRDLCGSLVAGEPELAADVLFGAATALALEAPVAAHMLGAWKRGASSLRGSATVYPSPHQALAG